MICYKLFRLKANGKLTSLFINKKQEYEIGQVYYAENHITRGYKERPYFHCVATPKANHLIMKNRVWCEVEVTDPIFIKRPLNQGGMWILASSIKIIKTL